MKLTQEQYDFLVSKVYSVYLHSNFPIQILAEEEIYPHEMLSNLALKAFVRAVPHLEQRKPLRDSVDENQEADFETGYQELVEKNLFLPLPPRPEESVLELEIPSIPTMPLNDPLIPSENNDAANIWELMFAMQKKIEIIDQEIHRIRLPSSAKQRDKENIASRLIASESLAVLKEEFANLQRALSASNNNEYVELHPAPAPLSPVTLPFDLSVADFFVKEESSPDSLARNPATSEELEVVLIPSEPPKTTSLVKQESSPKTRSRTAEMASLSDSGFFAAPRNNEGIKRGRCKTNVSDRQLDLLKSKEDAVLLGKRRVTTGVVTRSKT